MIGIQNAAPMAALWFVAERLGRGQAPPSRLRRSLGAVTECWCIGRQNANIILTNLEKIRLFRVSVTFGLPAHAAGVPDPMLRYQKHAVGAPSVVPARGRARPVSPSGRARRAPPGLARRALVRRARPTTLPRPGGRRK